MKNGKYTWSDPEFHDWVKKESKKVNSIFGSSHIGSRGITKILLNKVIIPNEISMDKLFKEKIKVNAKKR